MRPWLRLHELGWELGTLPNVTYKNSVEFMNQNHKKNFQSHREIVELSRPYYLSTHKNDGSWAAIYFQFFKALASFASASWIGGSQFEKKVVIVGMP